MQKLIDWIRNIQKNDIVAILHDRDADGVCSAVLVVKLLQRFEKDIAYRLHQNHGERTITPATIQLLKNANVTKLITTDLAVDQDPHTIKTLEEFCQILVFDHHKTVSDIQSDRTTVFRAQDMTDVFCPTSMLVYRLISQIDSTLEVDWIGSIGTLGDGAYEQWKNIIDESVEKQGLEVADFNKIADLILGISLLDDDQMLERLFWDIVEAEIPEDILLITKYTSAVEDLNKEVDFWVYYCEKTGERIGDIVYCKINPKHYVNSPVSTRLWNIFPDKTVILVQNRDKERVEISLRRKDGKQDVSLLVRKLIHGILDAKGGGHIRAAGGTFLTKDLPLIEERIHGTVKP